ncbi:gliding motility-associated C-terminal domain-containing protein [Pontibacter chitinilyticus]|uniref:gliding motility-associated C-terminal domain-containing protein n=1 Tax=Pontibacter chitinilyticus TaxID=2674989 RepID=UPI003219F10F
MKQILPLLLAFFLISFCPEQVLAQGCQVPSVSLPGSQVYCGPVTIAFNNTSAAHKPTYSGTIATYRWTIDGVVSASVDYPSFSFQEGHTYQVSITVSSSCGSATATQAITVDARPSAPVVENGGMCTGMQGTLWVTSPNPDYLYKWYNVPSGGTPLVWGTTYTTSTPGNYYIEATTRSGCTSATRTMASLTSSSSTGNGGGISTNSQQVCSGETPGTISGNAPNSSFMRYQWFQSTTGFDSDFFPIASARNRDYTPSPLSQTTWFKRVSYNNFCGEESNVLKITVIPRPVLPIVEDVIVCYGTQATFRVANADQSTVYKWYATAGSATAIGTGPSFTTPQALTATTSFFAEASSTANSACSSTTARVEARATVTAPITGNTVSSDQSLCSGGTPAPLTGTIPQGGGGTYTYQWQRSENGSDYTDIPGANAQGFAPGTLSITTWYRRKVSSTSSCPQSTSNAVRISVAPLPVSINITDPVACAGSGTTIIISNADPATYTYRWYDTASGGSILGTGSTFPTGALTSDKTYYVEATTAAGCISTRRPVTVTVTTPPAAPLASGATVCSGSSATLSVNPTNATLFYRWYNSSGTLLATGTSYSTGPLAADATFYVEAVTNASPGCTSPKTAVVVTVLQPINNNTITGNQMLCRGEIPASIQGSTPEGGGGGYTYQWQYSEDGTLFTNIPGATSRNYSPAAPSATTWFRRMAGTTAGTCAAVVSNLVTVTVNPLPVVPAIPGKTICTGSEATLQIPSPNDDLRYNWYTAATGGTAVSLDASSLTTEVLTSSKTYYVEAVTAFGCVSTPRRPVTVTVAPLPAVPVSDNVTVCSGTKATLSVLAPDPSLAYQWYDAAQGGSLLASGNSFMTPDALSASTTYFVQAVNEAGCASATRKAVAVTVTDLPAIPEVAGATICADNGTTLYISNPNAAFTYRWYRDGALLQTGTSLQTGNLTSSTMYEVDAVTSNSSACASPGRRAVTVNVIPPILNNSITASQAICSGSTPAPLTGTTATGGSGILAYQWEKSDNGTIFTAISGATAPGYSPDVLTTTTWYRRRVNGNNTCATSYSNTVQVMINALPATPIADNQTICTGATATLQVSAPAAGTTYKWYTAATAGNILSTEPTFTTDALDATTTFYVEATNASGCISPRRAVTVVVRVLPEAPVAADKTVCYGQSAILTVASPATGLTYKWYDANGQLLSSQSSLTVANAQATTLYYLEATYTSTPTCSSPRSAVTLTVTPLPGLPTVDDITLCAGTSGLLQVQNPDAGFTYKWYTSATGSTATRTGTSFPTPVLTSGKTYYVEAVTAGGCASSRKPVQVNVTPLPETPLAANATICVGQTVELAVTNASAALTYNWYASSSATTPLATGEIFPTGALQATTTYYLEAMTGTGCASASRQAVNVTVTALPAEPVAENKTTCAGGFAILSVQNPDASLKYKWYDEAGTQVGTNIFYNTGPLTENTTYYLEAVTDNSTACTSATRKAVTVTVTPVITNNTITASQTICSGSAPATLQGSVPSGGGTDYVYQWEQSVDGSSYTSITGATNRNYNPGTLTTTTWFRRKVSATGPCGPSYSTAVQITTAAPPATPFASTATICAGTTATLAIRDITPGYTYRWYAAATGGTILDIKDTFETPELSTTTTYYVEAVNSTNCVSARRAVTVYVTPLPELPQVPDKLVCQGQKATLTVAASAQNLVYTWYDNTGTQVGTGTSFTTPDPLSASTTFYVEASTTTTPACVSGRRAVAVTVTTTPEMPVANSVTICSGSTAHLEVNIIDPAITYKWYTTPTGGTAIEESPALTTSALTSGRTYYVEAVNRGGCTSARTAVVVEVVPLPATPAAANVAVCAGATASLSVSNAADNLVYNWYDAAVDGNLLASGTTYTTPALQASTTYYLAAATQNGCASTARSAVRVTVTPLPAMPQANDETVCGGTVTLWVANPSSGLLYRWYDQAGAYLATGTSYTTPALEVSTAYAVEAVTNTSTSCASAQRKTIYVNVVAPITNNSISDAQTICTGAVPDPFTGLTPDGGSGTYTYQWERSTDGINFTSISGATSQNYTPDVALTANTWYRRKVTATGSPCATSNSNSILVTITLPPATPAVAGATICAGTTAILQVSNASSTLTYRWFAAATGGSPLRSEPTFETPELSATTTFYVEAMNSTGCISPRRAVTVSVRQLPATPAVANKAICAGQTTTLAVTAPETGVNYKWYSTDGTLVYTGVSFPTPVLQQTMVYVVEASYVATPQCTAGARTTVTVEVAPLPQLPIAANTATCSGSTAILAVQVVDPNLTYRWYTAPAGGTAIATSSTYTTPVLTSDKSYYVEAVTAAGCASARTEVAVAVTPLPAAPLAANAAICAGQPATLAVTNPDAELSYAWYDAAAEGSLLATGDTYTTPTLTANATYFVEAVTATGCSSPSRRTVTITITPLPAIPEANNVTICAGSSTTLWVSNQEPNVVYNWYLGGALAGTGVSFTTGNLNTSTTYSLEAVTNTSTTCSSPARSTVVVTVTPAISNNFINANQTICSGSTPATLTGSLPNGGGGNYSYQWERSEDGVNFTSIAGVTTSDYTPNALNITTWFRRKVSAVGACAAQVSNVAQITITPVPATPAADNATVCEGSTATLRIQDVNTTYTYRWYTTPVGGSAMLAGTSFTTAPLESTTTYYVEAVNANGCISPRRTVTATVLPLPEAPLTSDQNICAGEQATLAVNNQEAGLTYSWYDGNGTLLATGTTYVTNPISSNTIFYVAATTATTPGCMSSRTAVVVNIATRPAVPVVANASVCAGSAAELTVSGVIPGLTYRWFTVATGGMPVHTGTAYTTSVLTSARTYYVEAATASGCTSTTRRSVTVSVIQPPAAPVAADRTICAGQPVTLAVANPNDALLYRWYAENGASLATGNTYTTTPAASTTFFVEAVTKTSPGCASPRETVNVTVTPLPASPAVADASICAGSTAILWITNTLPSVTYKWYDENEELKGTGTSFTTPVLNASTTYFVAAETAGGCASASRKTVTVTVTQPLANNVVRNDQTICSGSTPAGLTGTQPLGGTGTTIFQWESSEDGVSFRSITGATARDYSPGQLTATTWFRRKVTAGTVCATSTSPTVVVTVVPLPTRPVVQDLTVCAGGNATLAISSAAPAPSGEMTYRWYTTATGGSSIFTGSSLPLTAVQATTTYFVEAVNASGCTSARSAATVHVLSLPGAPVAADKAICAGESVTLSVTSPDSGLEYNWYDGNNVLQKTASSFTTPALDRTTNYYVEASTTTPESCRSTRTTVTVRVTQQPTAPTASNATICSGEKATLAVRNSDASLKYAWYTLATGGTALTTGTSYTTTNLTSGRIYYVEASTATGCTSARTAVTVNVTPLPALPQVNNQVVCAGETATLVVQNPDNTLSYRWYDAPVGDGLLATGNTFALPSMAQSRTVYVAAVTGSGCVSASRRAVVVTVMPLPLAPAADDARICSGENVTLWVKNPAPGLQYTWYSDEARVNQVGSGISYTSGTLTANKSFFIEAKNGFGCTSTALKQVDVSVISKPGAPVVNAVTVCVGSSATLAVSTPSADAVYTWYDQNGTLLHTGTTLTTEPLLANATFNVTASAASRQACASASTTVQVTVAPAITENEISTEQTICYNSAPAKLTGTFPAGGGNTLLYQWERSTDGINFAPIAGGNAQDYAPGSLTTTTWFRRKVKTAGPCPESISNMVQVIVSPLPNVPLADNTGTCAGSNAVLTVKNALSGITYNWYDAARGGTFLGSGISYTTEALTRSTTFYVEASNTSGCTSTSRRAVLVTVTSAIGNNVVQEVKPICYGEIPGRFTGTQPTGTNGSYTYQWQRSEIGVKFQDIPGATAQHYTPTEAYTKTTWFRRKVVATGPCPESYSNLVKLEVVPLPAIPTSTSAEVCPGSAATLTAAAATGEALEWYDAPEGGNLLHVGTTYTTPALTTSTSYFVQAVNSTQCTSSGRREVKATVVVPVAKVSGDVAILYGKAVKLTAEGGVAYQWSPAEGLSDASSASPMANPKETTTYTVTVTTAGGCVATNQVTVTVSPKLQPANVLTPNGDGFNDVFQIKHIEAYEDCSVQIFSRWGELVFESRGYTTPWDGTKKGQPLPVGAYYYIIHLTPNETPISGSVTLLK